MVHIPTPLPTRSTVLSHYRTSAQWRDYFLYNRETLLPLDWFCAYYLTPTERATIAHSIRMFQLGESSEGCHLLRAARQEANQSGDRVYVEALKLLIAEEQRHAADLGQFMDLQRIARARKHWTDDWFRKLRRLVNLEGAIVVLLSAELIATVYYKALQAATASPLLYQICRQILHDEAEHVVFQAAKLGILRQRRSPLYRWLAVAAHRLFFVIVVTIVWVDHHPTLQAGGYRWQRFWQEGWQAFEAAMTIVVTRKPIAPTC